MALSVNQSRTYSRRLVLRGATGAALAAVLAACGEAAAPTATSAPIVAPSRPPANPTAAGATVAVTAAPTVAPMVAPPVAVTTASAVVAPTMTPNATVAPGTTAPASAPAMAQGKIPSPLPGVPDAYTKRPSPFRSVMGVPGRGGTVSTFVVAFKPPPTSRDTNPYWQELEKRLGVKVEPSFVPAGTVAEKLAAFTAGNTLPDLTQLQLNLAPDQYKIIQQGGYTDLTPYLNADARKEYPNLAAIEELFWGGTTFNGKIYGVPNPTLIVSAGLYHRYDWTAKLGIAQPKNADEFLALMTAFKERDPDDNGANDTYGLGSQQGDFSGAIFYSMFRVPNGWRKNADGSLTKDLETPEFAQAIAFARRCWEAGVFHPDTLTMTNTQMQMMFDGSKFGATVGGVSGLAGWRERGKRVVPTSDVRVLIPPGHDGGRATTTRSNGVTNFVAIPARAGRDRERVRELLRVLDWYAAPFGSEENTFKANGVEGVHYTVQPDGTFKATPAGDQQIGDFPVMLGGRPVVYGATPDETILIQGQYKELAERGIDDPTLNLYSPAQAARQGQLSQLLRDRLGAIVSGREPRSALDGLIKDWRSRGGDQIRGEYEGALRGA